MTTNDPNITPPADPPADPPKEEVPSWAQSLIDQNADLSSRLESFEEKLQPPAPVEEPKVEPDEWKPNSWQDVDQRAEEKARAAAEAILSERDTATKTQQEQQETAAKEIDTFLDSQVDELVKANKLPKVENPNDPNDPGKLAQRELYGFALSLGTADLKSSHNTLDALHKAGKIYDHVKMELVDKNPASAGASSPVGSSSSGSSGTPVRPDYKTLHNTSLDTLAHRFMQNN